MTAGLTQIKGLTALNQAVGSGTTIESLGASPSASASANTSAIQTALNLSGTVSLLTPGTFLLNGPLTYKSGLRLTLGKNTVLKQSPGVNQMMLQSSTAVAFLAAGSTAVVLTWSAGTSCSVAWNAHGLSVGQAVWLTGSTPTVFNGVFRVLSVTDANNFVIAVRYLPSAVPSGSALAILATQDVLIEGGIWDYDFANNAAGAGRNLIALWFEGTADILVQNVSSQNAKKYAFGSAATLNFSAKNLKSPTTNSDGFKLYGPIFDCQIDGFKGITSDDGISVQGKEAAAFSQYQIAAGGDAINVSIKNVDVYSLNASVSAAVVYLSDNEVTDQILLDGVSGAATVGTASAAVKIQAGNAYTVGQFGNISLKNINAGNLQYTVKTGTCSGNLLTVESSKPNLMNPASTTCAFFESDSTSVVKKVLLKSCDLSQSGEPGSAVTAYLIVLNGTAEVFELNECTQVNQGAGTPRLVNLLGALVKVLSFTNCRADVSVIASVSATATNTPLVTVHGCNFEGNCSINAVASCNVALSGGNRYTNSGTNGIVRLSAGVTVNFQSDGTLRLVAGSVFSIVSGTPTLNCYGFDLSVDAGLIAVTKGQYFTHSSAVAGRNAANQQGPAIAVDGTHFYALGTGASGVNTLIL